MNCIEKSSESISQTALCLHKIYKNVYGIGAIIFRDFSVMSLLCCYFVDFLMSCHTPHSFTSFTVNYCRF